MTEIDSGPHENARRKLDSATPGLEEQLFLEGADDVHW